MSPTLQVIAAIGVTAVGCFLIHSITPAVLAIPLLVAFVVLNRARA
jgi:hypothetical protein